MKITINTSEPRILDFDMESVAAGFADPAWVPQKITAIAWSWVDSTKVRSEVISAEGLYTQPRRRAKMIMTFLEDLDKADMVTGHNLLRHDLPLLNAEILRLGISPHLGPIKVQDTMRFTRTKGFKKGQDNIAGLLNTHERKLSLDWQQWEEAYATPGWPVVRERCVSDVIMHKEMRDEMLLRGWLRPPVIWRP